jgi:uncharacterized protein YwgA
MPRKRDTEKVAAIIRDAGGRIVGRTRLQKIGYLLELAGMGEGFPFVYRHYGPYSEELAEAARDASALGLISEEEHPASWGGHYSIFTAPPVPAAEEIHPSRTALMRETVDASAIDLELAATAAYLAEAGSLDPWGDTARFKPEKAQGGHLENAKALYRRVQQIATPKSLPRIG